MGSYTRCVMAASVRASRSGSRPAAKCNVARARRTRTRFSRSQVRGSIRKDPGAEQGIETYTIVTTEANELLAPIHDRMPVVITERDYDRWLNADDPAVDLMQPLPPEALQVTKA